ncbi:hypothetical protein CDAR_98521 [Caerostris darwini]|uniref:Uncharacterized protein n=1 Tax=Caerostris darwini TaxID=1538125 RepID=A0AAV4UFQ8_9ARAC|nr:hypothetical protein CDAR_98521 [Caerostris darwini]
MRKEWLSLSISSQLPSCHWLKKRIPASKRTALRNKAPNCRAVRHTGQSSCQESTAGKKEAALFAKG